MPCPTLKPPPHRDRITETQVLRQRMAVMDSAHRRTGLLLLGSALRVSHHAAHRAILQWRLHLEEEQCLARSLAAREEDRESARQALGGLQKEVATARAALGKLREDVGGELLIFREDGTNLPNPKPEPEPET